MVSDAQSQATAELALVTESLMAANFNVVTAVCQEKFKRLLRSINLSITSILW